MRILVLLRGPPGVGKSTFIKDMKLEHYTIGSDTLRYMFKWSFFSILNEVTELIHSSPTLFPDGRWHANMGNEKQVWEHLFRFVENRMQNGDLTVVDATHCRTVMISRYHRLCDSYKYRLLILYWTDPFI